MSERLDPYDVAFGRSGLAERHFAAIATAAEAAGLDVTVADRFLMLPESNALVRELGLEGSHESFTERGLLAFHGFRFWSAGSLRLSIDEATLRGLVAGAPIGRWQLRGPAVAGYAQLPRQLVWTREGPEAALAVDGFFWSLQGDAHIDLLLVQGLVPGAASFNVSEVSAPIPSQGHWGDIHARAAGADFANLLPGGELRQLCGLTNAGELLKLASRIFHHDEQHGSVRDRTGAGGDRQPARADG
jgi:hypothetical protein